MLPVERRQDEDRVTEVKRKRRAAQTQECHTHHSGYVVGDAECNRRTSPPCRPCSSDAANPMGVPRDSTNALAMPSAAPLGPRAIPLAAPADRLWSRCRLPRSSLVSSPALRPPLPLLAPPATPLLDRLRSSAAVPRPQGKVRFLGIVCVSRCARARARAVARTFSEALQDLAEAPSQQASAPTQAGAVSAAEAAAHVAVDFAALPEEKQAAAPLLSQGRGGVSDFVPGAGAVEAATRNSRLALSHGGPPRSPPGRRSVMLLQTCSKATPWSGPASAKFRRFRPGAVPLPSRAKSGGTWANFGRSSGNFGRDRRTLLSRGAGLRSEVTPTLFRGIVFEQC